MRSSSRRKHPIRWLYRLISAVLFSLLATILVASANGYQFNFESRTFQSTGVIAVTVQQAPVSIALNDKKFVVTDKVSKFANLFPGYYSIKIEKDGYYPWVKNQYLIAGQATSYPFVRLFLADPTPLPATESEMLSFVVATSREVEHDDLDIRGNEVWVKPVTATYPIRTVSDQYVLVARYSQSLGTVIWYPGKTNIVMQIDDQIRVIDRDGSNDSVIANLSSSDPSLFYITDDGRYLFYQDNGEIYRRQLID